MCKGRGRGRERQAVTLTRIFLDELIDVDPAACAASVKHDPVENTVRVDRGEGFSHRPVNFRWAVRLGCRMHDFGHRGDSVRYRVDDFRCRLEDLRDHGVGRRAGLRDFRHRVGDLREEVFRVGRVLPVAVEVGDVAMVPVVSRLRQ